MSPSGPPRPPFVSVIVPVYNNASGIASTLSALRDQTYAADGYEVIVADNGSTDDGATVRAVERCVRAGDGAAVRLVVEAERRGSYAARNRGIARASGEILAFTDSDCVPAPDWIERGVAALERTDAGFAAGRIEMRFAGDEPNVWEYFDAAGKLNQRRYVEVYGFGATANLFLRAACVQRHGVFDAELRSGGDYEFGRRLTAAGERGVYADDAVVVHPARDTARAILRKERRIARGHAQLDAMPGSWHGRITWRKWIPVRRSRRLEGVPARLKHRVVYLLMANLVRYYNLFVRLTADARRPTAP